MTSIPAARDNHTWRGIDAATDETDLSRAIERRQKLVSA
jgi:hypothetical protein